MATDETDQAAVPLVDVDRNIIAELTRDGRMSVTQVAENVHISRAHAYTRIARLAGEGVLTKFTALVDPIKSSAYAAGRSEPDGPTHARCGEPVRVVNSAATSLPTLVPSASGSARISPGKARSS